MKTIITPVNWQITLVSFFNNDARVIISSYYAKLFFRNYIVGFTSSVLGFHHFDPTIVKYGIGITICIVIGVSRFRHR